MLISHDSSEHKVTQWQLFKVALSFFTRIPVKIEGNVNNNVLCEASRYFGVVGALVGLLMALCFYLLQLLFPASISALLLLAVNLLLTGAFHEDGLADVWDGFGGGWQVEDKLNIMKDSRLGTYGAAALFIGLALKYQSWQVLADSISLCLVTLVLVNGLSRCLAASLIYSMSYVQQDAQSKVKPLANSMSVSALVVLALTAVTLLLVPFFMNLMPLDMLLAIVVVLFFLRWCLTYWFKLQLGGYTGDCLGAAQVISEIAIYLTVIAIMLRQA